MKRMKRWMGIMLSVMLAAGSLQNPVFAAEAEAGAAAEMTAEAGATTETAAEAAEAVPEQEVAEAKAPAQEAEEQEAPEQQEITEAPDMEAASAAAMDSDSADIVDSGTCGDGLTWKLDREGTLTISGTGYMAGSPTWGGNEQSIFNVIIENGTKNISAPAFHSCSNLTSISIPESVTEIEGSAFSACSSLESIVIPNGVTSIGHNVFEGCSSLTGVTLSKSLKSIGFNAFFGCSNLESITIPESVTSIGTSAFFRCTGLTSITIPGGVTSIEQSLLGGCSSLESITIQEGVTSIGNAAISGCSNLKSVTIPKSVTSIGDWTFNGCNSLTSVAIPEGVTSIGDGAFSGCNSLESIMLPESVTSIGNNAFKDSSNVTVTVYSGTYAEDYVKSAGVRYKVICKTHKWNEEYTVEKGPTCAEEGLESIHCSVCDAVKEGSARAIAKTAHTWNEDYTIDKDPTYTEEGSKSIHCAVCDAVKEGSEVSIPKLVNPLGKTARGDMFNLANNVKVTWKEVSGAKYYKVYREGITDQNESRKEPVIVTTGLVGWDKDPGLTNGHAYRYKIVASLTGKGDSSGDSPLSYSKVMYRLKTVVIRSVKNTAPGKVTVKYDRTDCGDSYVLQYCERQDMVGAKTKVVLGADNTSYVIGGLKKGKTYFISIRVRKKVNGIDYYTTFGVAKKVTIPK